MQAMHTFGSNKIFAASDFFTYQASVLSLCHESEDMARHLPLKVNAEDYAADTRQQAPCGLPAKSITPAVRLAAVLLSRL